MKKLTFMILVIMFVGSACGPSANNSGNQAISNANTNTNKALTTPAPATCSDDAITQYIYDGVVNDPDLNNPDPKLNVRLKVNWYSKDCKVFLTGYALTIENFKKLEKYTLSAPGIVTMDNQKLWLLRDQIEYPQGCADGWTQCGDICIPPGQSCNNGWVKAGAVPSPKATGTP
jgi:hypothetical protein